MQVAGTMVFVGVLIFSAHLFTAIFTRTRIPDVLWLFALGLLLGPVSHLLGPGSFGAVGPVFTTVTLVFILFESGTNLHIQALQDSWKDTSRLTLLNFGVTTMVVGALVYAFTPLGVLRSLMTGSIVGGTSAAVVIPMIRSFSMQRGASTTLVLESAFSDVLTLGIPLALLEAHKVGEIRIGPLLGQIIAAFVLAVILGAVGAFVWSILLERVRNLQNSIFTTPAFVFIIYGLVELLGFSGPIAALAFGITLGNIRFFRPPILKRYITADGLTLNETERALFSEAVFLLRTFFFVYVGISILLTDARLILLGLTITLVLLVARVPIVGFSVAKTTHARDASLMGVLIPKGLGAAVLATVPVQEGVEGGVVTQTLVFSIILFSTLLTTLLVFLLENTPLARLYERVFLRFGMSPAPAEEAG